MQRPPAEKANPWKREKRLHDAAVGQRNSVMTLFTSMNSTIWYTYGIIQILVLSLLIFRLLVVASFQSRVSVITESLAAAAEELLHILGIVVIVTIMFAFQGFILFGHRFYRLSTFDDAIYWTARAFLEANTTSNTYLLHATASSRTWENQSDTGRGRFHEAVPDMERVVVVTSGVIWALLSYFLLFIIMSSLIIHFESIRKRKQVLGNQTTALQDLQHVVFPNFIRRLHELVHTPDGSSDSREASNLYLRNLLRQQVMHGEYKQQPSIRIPVIECHVGVSRYDRVMQELERSKIREAMLDPDAMINRDNFKQEKLKEREDYVAWLAKHQAQNALVGRRDDILHRFTRDALQGLLISWAMARASAREELMRWQVEQENMTREALSKGLRELSSRAHLGSPSPSKPSKLSFLPPSISSRLALMQGKVVMRLGGSGSNRVAPEPSNKSSSILPVTEPSPLPLFTPSLASQHIGSSSNVKKASNLGPCLASSADSGQLRTTSAAMEENSPLYPTITATSWVNQSAAVAEGNSSTVAEGNEGDEKEIMPGHGSFIASNGKSVQAAFSPSFGANDEGGGLSRAATGSPTLPGDKPMPAAVGLKEEELLRQMMMFEAGVDSILVADRLMSALARGFNFKSGSVEENDLLKTRNMLGKVTKPQRRGGRKTRSKNASKAPSFTAKKTGALHHALGLQGFRAPSFTAKKTPIASTPLNQAKARPENALLYSRLRAAICEIEGWQDETMSWQARARDQLATTLKANERLIAARLGRKPAEVSSQPTLRLEASLAME